MREIKFRGHYRFDHEDGRASECWVYGYYFKHPETDTHSIFLMDGKGSRVVDKSSVGQYTGLRGDGGVDVYEGDLVEIEDNEGQKCPPYIIEWSESRYNFIGRCVDGMDDMMLEEFECCKVIGNIYQNPELLTA